MSESQSRYSIVERLTEQKLQIIEDRARLVLSITASKQQVEKLRKGLIDWENDVKEENIKSRRVMERNIEQAEITVKNANEQKKHREGTYDKKLTVLEEALVRLQKISEASE